MFLQQITLFWLKRNLKQIWGGKGYRHDEGGRGSFPMRFASLSGRWRGWHNKVGRKDVHVSKLSAACSEIKGCIHVNILQEVWAAFHTIGG